MRVGRDLLEEVALSGAARPELDEVVVALDERDHAQDGYSLSAFGECRGLEPDGPNQEVDPFLCGERAPGLREHVEHVRLRHLNRAHRLDRERAASLLL